MLRFHPLASAKAAEAYYAKSDGGYYLGGDLRQDWLGKGAERLGLSGPPEFEQFKRLLRGLDPHTGSALTAKLVDHRLAGWDVTASVPKGVTLALEWGDTRIQDAIWAAARETLADLEAHAVTRVRTGGRQDDRATGNLVAFAVEHAETRPAKCDGVPDPDRHLHLVVMNVTHDQVEDRWKAVKFRPIMDLRKYFDRRFDLRLSTKLAELGYGIDTKYKGGKYHTWDVSGFSPETLAKFSRRSAEIETLAAELGVDSPVARDKLGATSRAAKRTDLAPDDLRAHWRSRTSTAEDRQIEGVIRDATLGLNPPPANTAEHGVRFAIAHQFYTHAVARWTDVAVTAMQECFGGAKPEEIEPEARQQGVLFKDGQVTTREVLAQERGIVAFAREGRGSCRPLAASAAPLRDDPPGLTLSPEQRAFVAHIRTSTDRVILARGAAGVGKTTTMKATLAGVEGVAVLAPTVNAGRGVLRDDGFQQGDTLAAFLKDPDWQARTKLVYLDEATLTPTRDLAALCGLARQHQMRLILQGDPRQHKSVLRHGDLFRVLEEHAGLRAAELTDIRRQSGRYKEAVAAIQGGDVLKGHDLLTELGWVKQGEGDRALIDDYLDALASKRPGQADKDRALILAPTHAAGDRITRELRARLPLGPEVAVKQLVPLHWSEAERADLSRYDGSETLVFHHRSGTFNAGQVVKVKDWQPGWRFKSGSHFAVYAERTLPVAVGDTIRTTANVKDVDGKRVDNGTLMTVTAITPTAIVTDRRTLPIDVGHLTHGYVATSMGGQGRTVDVVLAAMNADSLPALRTEQFYVDVSRARHRATIYSDVPSDELRNAIRRTDTRQSAIALMTPKPVTPARPRPTLRRRLLAWFGRLREAVGRGITPEQKREVEYGRV